MPAKKKEPSTKKVIARAGEGSASGDAALAPDLQLDDGGVRVWIGDCRGKLATLKPALAGKVDLVFADPPFNWNRAYDKWNDSMPREDFVQFTYEWIDACLELLSERGSFWINIPDDTCAEIVMHMKARKMEMVNWCIWHYRFGQNTTSRFVNSKVHALYFARDAKNRTWNPMEIVEPSDRATTYFDPRTTSKKDGMPPGMRVPLDVWYGAYWGRVQGNNKERRGYHDNQLPEAYLERVILSTSNEGDLVLDPFLGSGTTAVMARAYGRRFIGTEFSKANAKSALERIKAGPVHKGMALNKSSAIFEARSAGRATRAKFAQVVAGADSEAESD
jgi:site-specific DNA-methyltransferase (adenine-specific)